MILKFIDKLLAMGFILLFWLIILYLLFHDLVSFDNFLKEQEAKICEPCNALRKARLYDLLYGSLMFPLVLFSCAIIPPWIAWEFGFIKLILSIPYRLAFYYQHNIKLCLFGTTEEINRIIPHNSTDPLWIRWLFQTWLGSRVFVLLVPTEMFEMNHSHTA
jgi:hypothetical protein